MSRVEQSIAVRCPFAVGLFHLGHFFRMHESADGETAKVALHVTAAIVGLDKPSNLHRSVVATFAPAPPASAAHACYRIQWEPETAGAFPVFTGELFLEANSTRASLSLRLHGVYTPPLAFLGANRDVMGNRLAVATADQLLLEIRDFMERDVRIENARKRPVRRTMTDYEQVSSPD